MNIVIEQDGVRHRLVEGHVHCKDCSFGSCAKRPYPLCNALATMFGYHFEIEKGEIAMTRETETWQKALIEAKDNPDDFVRGAKWADKTMLDKACEWLDGVIYDYVELNHSNIDAFFNIDNERLVEDFRKAMEK